MKITAIIREVEGQLFVEFTGDMKDIVPVDEVKVEHELNKVPFYTSFQYEHRRKTK